MKRKQKVSDTNRLLGALTVARDRLEALLEVHEFIDDETGHQTILTKSALACVNHALQPPNPSVRGEKVSNKSSFWTVRFKTKDGAYHPVYYGSPSGIKVDRCAIQKLANDYLMEHADWLLKVDEIYSPEDTVTKST